MVALGVAQRVDFRCPVCGLSRQPRFFGVNEGEFDPEDRPQHVLEAREYTYGGDRSITVERRPLSLEEALALRRSLAAALQHLDDELEEATGDSVADLLAH